MRIPIAKARSEGRTTSRRPAQFWAPLNTWWRAYLEEKGRRPVTAEVQVWYDQYADAVWGDAKPNWKEARVHAKCLRSTEQVKKYFREYRARGRASDDCHPQSSEGQEPGIKQEDGQGDEAIGSLIAEHNALIAGRTSPAPSGLPPTSSGSAAFPKPMPRHGMSAPPYPRIPKQEPTFSMMNPTTITTGDGPPALWQNRANTDAKFGRSGSHRVSLDEGKQLGHEQLERSISFGPGPYPSLTVVPRHSFSMFSHANSINESGSIHAIASAPTMAGADSASGSGASAAHNLNTGGGRQVRRHTTEHAYESAAVPAVSALAFGRSGPAPPGAFQPAGTPGGRENQQAAGAWDGGSTAQLDDSIMGSRQASGVMESLESNRLHLPPTTSSPGLEKSSSSSVAGSSAVALQWGRSGSMPDYRQGMPPSEGEPAPGSSTFTLPLSNSLNELAELWSLIEDDRGEQQQQRHSDPRVSTGATVSGLTHQHGPSGHSQQHGRSGPSQQQGPSDYGAGGESGSLVVPRSASLPPNFRARGPGRQALLQTLQQQQQAAISEPYKWQQQQQQQYEAMNPVQNQSPYSSVPHSGSKTVAYAPCSPSSESVPLTLPHGSFQYVEDTQYTVPYPHRDIQPQATLDKQQDQQNTWQRQQQQQQQQQHHNRPANVNVSELKPCLLPEDVENQLPISPFENAKVHSNVLPSMNSYGKEVLEEWQQQQQQQWWQAGEQERHKQEQQQQNQPWPQQQSKQEQQQWPPQRSYKLPFLSEAQASHGSDTGYAQSMSNQFAGSTMGALTTGGTEPLMQRGSLGRMHHHAPLHGSNSAGVGTWEGGQGGKAVGEAAEGGMEWEGMDKGMDKGQIAYGKGFRDSWGQ